jgi:ankyrin repeat protein/serine/threonine protein kinase
MSNVSVALTPKNLPTLLKRGTTTKEILKMVKKAPKDVLSRRDDAGQTLLHIAAAEGELELLQKMVEKFKANLEERDKNDWRPLHCATLGKHLSIMQYLLKAGASPAAANVESATALHYFAKIPPPTSATEEPLYQDVLTRLIHKAGHINIQNKSGQTALHKAVLERTERTLLINDLLSAKADVLLADSNGETAAHIVARNGNREVFEKLLKVGGNAVLMAVSSNSETAYSVARTANHEHLSTFILQWATSHGLTEAQLMPASAEGSYQGYEGNANGSASPQLSHSSVPTEYLLYEPPTDPDVIARQNGIRRINIVRHLITGEQQLVQQLKWLNSTLADPIKEHYSAFSISLVELNTLFNSELATLYKKHRSILETLKTRLKDFRGDHSAFGVGDIFAELHTLRPHYKLFAAGAEESVLACRRLLMNNHQFAALVIKVAETAKNAPNRPTDVPAMLLSPVERVCSYPALLRDLSAVTPEGHPDKGHLDLAMEYASQLATDFLHVKKAAITKARITAIEESLEGFSEELYKPGREFVFEESILVKSLTSKGKQIPIRCSVYLFNDLILWARKGAPSGTPTEGARPPPMLGSIASATFSVTNLNNGSTNGGLFGSGGGSSDKLKSLSYCGSMSLKYVSTVTGTVDPDMKHAFEVSCEKENLRYVFSCESDESRLGWISRICNQVSRVSLYQMWNTQNSSKGPSKRVSHTATVVGSRLYVFGGQYQNHYYNDLYIFHLENREWTKVPTPMSIGGEGNAVCPTPRCEHSAVVVGSRIVFFGGFDGQKRLKDLYVFDTTTLKWMKPTIQSKRVPGGRSGHKMVFLHNLVWLFGGIDSHGTYLNDIYTLNLEKWQWSSVPISGKMPAPRAFHSMDVLKTKIAVYGGYSFSKCHDDVALLDTKRQTWTIQSGEELRMAAASTTMSMMASGAAASGTKNAAASLKLVPSGSGMMASASTGSVNSATSLTPTTSGATLAINSEVDNAAPLGRYHHASFVVEDYILIQGGLAQGTASFCDLWALTTIEEQVVWYPVPVALQLDHRFRHSISSFKNKTSGKIQAMMFGGISGLATSSAHPSDVILFKDMELMVSTLTKNYRRTVRKVAAISKPDLMADVQISQAGKWGTQQHPNSRRSNSPVIGRDRVASSEGPPQLTTAPSAMALAAKFYDPAELDNIDSLPPFAPSSFNPETAKPEVDFKLVHALDSARTMWMAKHVPTNSALLITALRKSKASHLLSNVEELTNMLGPQGILPYFAVLAVGEEVWLLQEMAVCSAAGVVRTLGVTLSEHSLSVIARSALEAIASVHKTYSSPSGICPEFLTLNQQGHLRLAHHGIYDYIKDETRPPAKSSKEKDKNVYIGHLFDASEVFVSPELHDARQNTSSKSINGEKSDIYSLALSLLFLFTGSIPISLLPSDMRSSVPLATVLPNTGSGTGEISSAFREFLMHCLECNPSKRPLAKILLDHSFVAAAKGSKPDSSLQEFINLWKLYRGRGKGEGKPRDGYDMAKKFKPATDMPQQSPRQKKKARRSRSEASGLGADMEGLDSSVGSLRDLNDTSDDSDAPNKLQPAVSFRDDNTDSDSTTEISFRHPKKPTHKRSGSDTNAKEARRKAGSPPSGRAAKAKSTASSSHSRKLRRQNTYDQGSGAVVSRAFADDDDDEERGGSGRGPRGGSNGGRSDEVDRGPMAFGDEDESAEEEDDRSVASEYGDDDEEPGASASQLRLLQEEYMEFQQSTAENQTRTASELAELRMRLSTVQNELASTQAEFERRLEERVEREVAGVKAQMARDVEAKVLEQRDASESRFARHLEMMKYQLADEFKSLQRDIYRFVGGATGAAPPQQPTGTQTGAARRTAQTPMWKTRPAGRMSQNSLANTPTASRSQTSVGGSSASGLETLDESSSGSDFVGSQGSQGSNPAMLSSSSLYSHPKSLSDPVMTVSEAESRQAAPLPSVLAQPSQPSQPKATIKPSPQTPTTTTKTHTSQTPQTPQTQSKAAPKASAAVPLNTSSASVQSGAGSSSTKSDTGSLHSSTNEAQPKAKMSASTEIKTTIAAAPPSSSMEPSTSGSKLAAPKSISRSSSSEGMSEAAREATQKASVDVSKIWASHSKATSPTMPKK